MPRQPKDKKRNFFEAFEDEEEDDVHPSRLQNLGASVRAVSDGGESSSSHDPNQIVDRGVLQSESEEQLPS